MATELDAGLGLSAKQLAGCFAEHDRSWVASKLGPFIPRQRTCQRLLRHVRFVLPTLAKEGSNADFRRLDLPRPLRALNLQCLKLFNDNKGQITQLL